MKNFWKKIFPYVMFGTAWVLILAAFLLVYPGRGPFGLRGGWNRVEPHPDVPGTAKRV